MSRNAAGWVVGVWIKDGGSLVGPSSRFAAWSMFFRPAMSWFRCGMLVLTVSNSDTSALSSVKSIGAEESLHVGKRSAARRVDHPACSSSSRCDCHVLDDSEAAAARLYALGGSASQCSRRSSAH